MDRGGPGFSFSSFRRGRLAAAIGLAVLLLAGSVAAVDQMTRMGADLEEISQRELPLADTVTRFTAARLEQEIALQRAFRLAEEVQAGLPQAPRFDAAVEHFRKYAMAAGAGLGRADQMVHRLTAEARVWSHIEQAESIRQALSEISRLHAEYVNEAEGVITLLGAGDVESARIRMASMEQDQGAFRKVVADLEKNFESLVETTAQAAVQHENEAFYWLVAICVVAALTALALVGRDYLALTAAYRRHGRTDRGQRA